jgi:hypothetical protein
MHGVSCVHIMACCFWLDAGVCCVVAVAHGMQLIGPITNMASVWGHFESAAALRLCKLQGDVM